MVSYSSAGSGLLRFGFSSLNAVSQSAKLIHPPFSATAVAKSLGFSWGAAGLSTALFTGVFLADVLDYVQPSNDGKIGEPGFRRAEHVIFEGAEDLPKGKYGTSQRLRWARMKEKGMMLAWAMNGEVSQCLCWERKSAELTTVDPPQALEPDHGTLHSLTRQLFLGDCGALR